VGFKSDETPSLLNTRGSPTLSDYVHGVILVTSGQDGEMSDDDFKKMNEFRALLQGRQMFPMVAMTKADIVDPKLNGLMASVFGSVATSTRVVEISLKTGFSLGQIVPCKPYTAEYARDTSVESLALIVLNQAAKEGERYRAKLAAAETPTRRFAVSDNVDAKDLRGAWYAASILSLSSTGYRVSFRGFNHSFDEDVLESSVATAYTHVART